MLGNTAAAWLETIRKRDLSDPVTYTRGQESIELQATAGRSEHPAFTADGVVTTVEAADFLFAAADLVLGGRLATPQRGDTILSGQETYQVLAPAAGETEWEYLGPAKLTIRVHTKLIVGDPQ
jgi:hypothetical protein